MFLPSLVAKQFGKNRENIRNYQTQKKKQQIFPKTQEKQKNSNDGDSRNAVGHMNCKRIKRHCGIPHRYQHPTTANLAKRHLPHDSAQRPTKKPGTASVPHTPRPNQEEPRQERAGQNHPYLEPPVTVRLPTHGIRRGAAPRVPLLQIQAWAEAPSPVAASCRLQPLPVPRGALHPLPVIPSSLRGFLPCSRPARRIRVRGWQGGVSVKPLLATHCALVGCGGRAAEDAGSGEGDTGIWPPSGRERIF